MLSGTDLLSAPMVRTDPGKAAIGFYGPHLWNNLPEHLCVHMLSAY